MTARARWVVCKFGGTSVATAERWGTIADVVRQRRDEGLRPLVVCSAVAGVSKALWALLDAAPAGEHGPLLDDIEGVHRALAADLGIPLPTAVEAELDFLRRVSDGISLVGEVSPRTHARVLATGELMCTALGAAWLATVGIDATWLDARDLLSAREAVSLPDERRYLSATCDHAPDHELRDRLEQTAGDALLSQGFIARDPSSGDTVLLGRGGSDTSATLLAARLGAVRCEIWTDVPGMFTADPRRFPSARLLRELDYGEAQEIATMGARVLHPACLPPARSAELPLQIHCTADPSLPGTSIRNRPGGAPGIKAVSTRGGLMLVSMETVGMWQQVGFLADAFAQFTRLGLSIDLVATSETNVTVSLDPTANVLDEETLGRLERALRPLCEPRIVRGCASVSLVGHGIRSILHRLSAVFELFEEQRVHLVTQAANDLNLTVVVDEGQAERLVGQLHGLLLAEVEGGADFGPTWAELGQSPEPVAVERPWWQLRRAELVAIATASSESTPCYVYDGPTVDASARALLAVPAVDEVLYAMKANPHPILLRRLADLGVGFECVSPGEVARARTVLDESGSAAPLLFTPNFAPRGDYVAGFAAGARVTLDNLAPLESWPEVFAGREVFVRVDPGEGAGHHAHVRTAGARSKFGVAFDQVPALVELARRHDVRIVGLHAHVGSGVRDPGAWPKTARLLGELLGDLPDVEVLDLGGGLGVPEKRGQSGLDLRRLGDLLADVRTALRQERPDLELWLEPGRFLVAQAGVLLARVTQRKQKGSVSYVGVDAGMHTLIRPALYGAWHDIVNLSRFDESDPPLEMVDVVGPICETGDVLGRSRRLRSPREGDVLLVATAGAYGFAMASDYNLRGLPAQVVLD